MSATAEPATAGAPVLNDVERAALAALTAALSSVPLRSRREPLTLLATRPATAVLEALAQGDGPGAQSARRTLDRDPELTSSVARLRELASRGIRLVARGDANWPGQLEDLGAEAPAALWVHGALPEWGDGSLAIVGSRRTSEHGLDVIAKAVSTLEVPVVSGLALGADGAAHAAAVAVGVPTVAVLPAGLDEIYPTPHVPLANRILSAGGALVSEYPPRTMIQRDRFLERNRLIAALGRGSLIIEASARSGTMNEAGHAQSIGRRIGAVPGTPGCDSLITAGIAIPVHARTDVESLYQDA